MLDRIIDVCDGDEFFRAKSNKIAREAARFSKNNAKIARNEC